MQLLNRSNTSKERSSRTTNDIQGFHLSVDQQRPSLHIPRHDVASRRAMPARPKTADNDGRHSKLARMSFFEAFAIDAGDDTFAFPKPSSAKTTPKELDLIIVSMPSSPAVSPLIGVAYGSPSNPPQVWTRYPSFGSGSANTTPRFANSFQTDFTLERDVARSPRAKSITAWQRLGGLFRRSTKSSKGDNKSIARPQPTPKIQPLSQQRPSTSSKSPRPKSRGRMMTLRRKETSSSIRPMDSKVDLSIDNVVRTVEVRVDHETTHGASTHQEHFYRPSKASRLLGAEDMALGIILHPPQDSPPPAKAIKPSTPAPRLELQLPSCQMERYSVMFEKVLDPKPSLLERRQSRLRLQDVTGMYHTTNMLDLTRLSPLAEIATPRRPLTRSATSPSSPSFAARSQPPVQERSSKNPAFHKPLPALQRSNTAPALRISPLLPDFAAGLHMHPLQTFSESPVSADEDERPLPLTPPYSDDLDLRILVDLADRKDMYADNNTNVWQSVLPPPPASSTSSRFSVDVHKALDSPRLVSRSRSYNGKDNTSRPIVRQVQVAVARRVSVSRAVAAAQLGGPVNISLKPKMIQVGAQPHSRKTSVLDTYDELSETTIRKNI